MGSHFISSSLPIHELPVELLVAIFLRSLPTSYAIPDKRPPNKSITDPPLIPIILASVCQAWRSLVCNTPQLWENCWLSYNHPELNIIWLNRAGSQMLNLHAQCTELTVRAWEVQGRDGQEAFMSSILPYQQRWKLFNIDTGPFKQGWIQGPLIEFDTPALETFRVCDRDGSSPGPAPDPVWAQILVLNAPSLRELKLHYSEGITFLQSQFYHLVDLGIEDIDAGMVSSILDGLPRLRKLAVRVQDDGNILHHIRHDNLTYFHYKGDWEDASRSIPSCLTLPSLRNLHLTSTSLHGLLSFLDRSQCSITELVLADDLLDDSMLISILAHKSVDCWLETLKLDRCSHGYITPQFLEFLEYNPEEPALVCLESLTVVGYHFLDVQEGFLADTTGSRCRSHVCVWNGEQKGVRLRYLSLGLLLHQTHGLDIARMTPISTLPYLADDNSLFVELDLSTNLVKFMVRRPSLDSYPDEDLY